MLPQPFVKAQIKGKRKTPRPWPLWGKPSVTGGFHSQRAGNAENDSIWWRHHVMNVVLAVLGGWLLYVGCAITKRYTPAGLSLGLRPANERPRYFVTMSLIGWAHAFSPDFLTNWKQYKHQTSSAAMWCVYHGFSRGTLTSGIIYIYICNTCNLDLLFFNLTPYSWGHKES